MTSATRTLLPREERQAQLLGAAARAFARAGFAATSMDDVAAEAGVTKLIVYRHFDSKEELYRSVLDGVNARIADELVRAFAEPSDRPRILASLLTVARADPDAFRLLMVHAPREPQFSDEVADYQRKAVRFADELIGAGFADPSMRAWGDQMAVDYFVRSVLHWLDTGDPDHDEEFVTRANSGLLAMLQAWRA